MITQLQEVMTDYAELLEMQRSVGELAVRLGQKINALSTLVEGSGSEIRSPQVIETGASDHDLFDDEQIVLDYLRGFVGTGGGQYPSAIASATSFHENTCRTMLNTLVTKGLARSFTVEGALCYAPTKWESEIESADPGPVLDSINAPISTVETPLDPLPPDDPGIAGPPPRVRQKELPRTCIEWANDDASWNSYVSSVRRNGGDDHPLNVRLVGCADVANELALLRDKFRTNLHVIADPQKYARPGAKFTRWLETGAT